MRALVALFALVSACESFGTDQETSTGADAGIGPDGGLTSNSDAARDSGNGAPGAACQEGVSVSCLTFDSSIKPFDTWTQDADNGDPPRVVDGALATKLNPPTTGDKSFASRLLYDLKTKPKHTRLSFRVKVDGTIPIESDRQITLAEFLCYEASGDSLAGALVNVQAGWQLGGTLLTVEPFAFTGGATTLKPDVWTAMALDVVWSGADARYELIVDGASVSHGPVPSDQNCLERPVFNARLGLGSATGQGGKALYDDVVLDLLP